MVKKTKRYGGIIKSASGKYLLVKGTVGKWSFPKGRIEIGETPEQCAIREIYEETGYLFDNLQNKMPKMISSYKYYELFIENEFIPKPLSKWEIPDAGWFLPEDTNKLDKNKDVKVFFTKLLKNK